MDRAKVVTEVEEDMKALYGDLKSKDTDRNNADSLANIAGKRLKAAQLHLADEMLLQKVGRK
jgi:hypothetical protein